MKFIAETDNSAYVRELLKTDGPLKCAVAFLGDHPAILSALKERRRKAEFICNLESGACNPAAVKKLGLARVKTNPRLHAKVYWTPERAIVGSANLSTNGLWLEGKDLEGWIEAGIEVTDRSTLKDIEEWFDQLGKTSHKITSADIKKAEKRWKPSRPGKPRRTSLLAAMRNPPAELKDRIIFGVVTDTMSKEDEKEADEILAKIGGDDYYQDYDDLPKGAFVIDYEWMEEHKPPTCSGIWKCIGKGRTRNTKASIQLLEEKGSHIGAYSLTSDDKKKLKKFIENCGREYWDRLTKGIPLEKIVNKVLRETA